MTVGLYLLALVAIGYAAVYIRERYLFLGWLKPISYVGVLIHESSHALFCLITGGRIVSFRVSSNAGSVSHFEPKVPIVGNILIAIGPLIGGFIVFGLINYFFFNLVDLPNNVWQQVLWIFSQINLLKLSGWLMLFLCLNIGVIVGPSLQDLKNIWPVVVLALFVPASALSPVLTLAVVMSGINLILFLILAWGKKLLAR